MNSIHLRAYFSSKKILSNKTRKLTSGFLILIITLFFFPSLSKAQILESVYSPLGKACVPTKQKVDEKKGDYKNHTYFQCPGVAGYHIILDRMGTQTTQDSLRLAFPNGKEVKLPDSVCSDDCMPSVAGAQAEWRVSKVGGLAPQALIIRMNAASCKSGKFKTDSSLAIIKISPQEICFTDKIPASPKQNELARKAADEASVKSCHFSSCEDKEFKWCHDEGEPCGH